MPPLNKIYSFQDIQNLVKSQAFQEAFLALGDYLKRNYHDTKAQKLHLKLKKILLKENIQKIEEAIHKFDYLRKEKKYNQLLNAYLQIIQYAPDYQPLIKKINKLQTLINQDTQNEIYQKYQTVKNIAQQKLQNQEFQEVIQFLADSITKFPENGLIKQLLVDTKRQIIDFKLSKNQQLLSQDSGPKAFEFIKALYHFEPTYSKIQKLLHSYHHKLQQYETSKKQFFIRDSLNQIHILFNQKKYQKCLQASNEFLRTAIYHKKATKYRNKAIKAIINQNFTKAYQMLT